MKNVKMLLSDIQIYKSYRTYLMTYLVVLVVPLFITIFGYLYSSRTIQEETYNYHFNLLKQTKQMYDQIAETAQACGYLISNDATLESLLYQKVWGGEQRIDALELRDVLSSVRGSSIYIESVSVYFYHSKSLVTVGRRYPEELIYQYMDEFGVKADEFLEKIDSGKLTGYFLLGGGKRGERGRQTDFFLPECLQLFF